MPLTRLDNLISSKTGKYLYVSPDDFNATDALSNRGNSPVTPFKSIQRAFLEVARYSYTPGPSNDRFDQFSIMLMPGIHYIDNRPGLVDTTGITEFDFDELSNSWGDDPILDVGDPDNILYLFNNTEGGAIIPRGSSLVGYDLRRTTIRPLYVPDPASVTVPRSAIFNVTGGCYFWQFTIKDGQTTAESPLYNPAIGSGEVYYDPTNFTKKAVPNFSHHKLTVFEYADKEELQLFYRKIAKAFSKYQTTIDDPGEFDYSVQENRIVGPLSDSRVIESLKFSNIVGTSSCEIEVTTKVDHGYFAGQFVAIANTEIDEEIEGFWPIYDISDDPRKFTYRVPFVVSGIGQGLTNLSVVSVDSSPVALGQNAQVLAEVDSVESASPYVFNVSIRSVWGVCGIWANGLKATGFKSMVIAQYTGVSLQRDDRAFIRYDEYANTWNQASLIDAFATVPYHAKGDSYWKDDWRNFHVRASDDAFIQNVSIFAVGFADHFLMESGGDMSITNSNSNFGNTSLHAIGFKGFSFNQDKAGYITDIIPPQRVVESETNREKILYYTIDVQGTKQNPLNRTKLFLGGTDLDNPLNRPAATIDGYRIGAKSNDKLYFKDGQVYETTIEPTGFVKYLAKGSVLNPTNFTDDGLIDNLNIDAANLIESNRRMIQEEVFGYILEKYPRLQNIPYVNPGLNPAAGRYFDARNLILSNRQEIVDTAFDQMVETFGISNIQGVANGKCKRDIGYIVDAIAEDLRDGGNANIIEATRFYFNANGSPISNGLVGEEDPSIFAFNRARDLCKKAIANLLSVTATIYDPDTNSVFNKPGNPYGYIFGTTGSAALGYDSEGVTVDASNKQDPAGRYKDARNRIVANRNSILDSGITAITTAYPSFVFPGGSSTKCRRDLGYIVDAVSQDLWFGGNEYTIAAVVEYFNGNTLLTNGVFGEVPQTEAALQEIKSKMKLAATNGMASKDLTITADPDTESNIDPASCEDVRSTIDTLVDIFIDTLNAGDLNDLPPTSNGEWDCANVRSSIDTLFDILTDSIQSGSLNNLPTINTGDFVTNAEESKCFRDVSYIVDAIVNDLRYGGNINSVQAGEAYYVGNQLDYIDGEKTETIDAWNYVGQMAIAAMRNFDFLAFNVATENGSPIIDVGDTSGIIIGMRVEQYSSSSYTNGLLNSNVVYENNHIDSTIPKDTYVRRIVDSSRIELGVKNSRLYTGNTVNAKQTFTAFGGGLNLYFTFENGQWANTLPKTVTVGPESSNPDVIQDTTISSSQRECASTALAITQLVNNITTIINVGLTYVDGGGNILPTVDRQEPTFNTALLASRATVFTIDTDGIGQPNSHNFETGTPVRLVPRPRFDTASGKYVDVDKRLVRLPNGFDTNTTYYVIAPGRATNPVDYSVTAYFNGSDQTKLMLATSKQNAAAGIYIYASETESIDPDIEIDLYQFVIDEKYDLHTYSCDLFDGIPGGIETDIANIFDKPSTATIPQKVFFRAIEGSELPDLSSTYAEDPTVAIISGTNSGKINPNVEFFVRYQTNKVFTIHKTIEDALSNTFPISFASQNGPFRVFANKKRSPMRFDPTFNGVDTVNGKWFIQTKDSITGQNDQTIVNKEIYTVLNSSNYQGKTLTTDTWFERINDTRSASDRTYKLRYVIPKYIENARDPINGFVIKTRTDDTRKLVPQKLLLKPVAGNVYGARFENEQQSGEFIGFTNSQFVNNLKLEDAYDPYRRPLTGQPQNSNYKKIARFSSGIAATIQSGRYVKDVFDENIEYLEITVFDHTVDTVNFPGLRNEIFTTVKITAPQGGSFVSNKTEKISTNIVSFSGNSSGSAYIHGYYNVGGDHYLIIKGISGTKGTNSLEYSEFQNTRFTQGSVFADMLEDQDMGKSLPLKTHIRKKFPEYFYKQNGANVYTITPGDRIQDDAGIEYYVYSVKDTGVIEDTFYIFDSQELQKRIPGQQDGVYYLTVLRGNISPYPLGSGVGGNFRKFKFSQPVGKLYPLNYRNDPLWFTKNGTTEQEKNYYSQLIDPPQAFSAADNYIHGKVTVNDTKNSVTKELIIDLLKQPSFVENSYTNENVIEAQLGNASSGSEDRLIPIAGDSTVVSDQRYYVELRRPSIARAGNHTFEYLGFGPGNYSTGLPARQEIVLTPDEDFYAQSKKQDAGIVFYTGINSQGDLYIGNRRINAITGEETFIDRAVLVDDGDKDDIIGQLVASFETAVTFNENITIVGGPEGDLVSNFNAPIAITVLDGLAIDGGQLKQQGLPLIIRSFVAETDYFGVPQDYGTLDRQNFSLASNGIDNRGDIRIGKNRVDSAIFAFNPRGGGQNYKIQTHAPGGVASNITPNQDSLISAGGSRISASQYTTYTTLLPETGDILLKGDSIGKNGSLGWIFANIFTNVSNTVISSIQVIVDQNVNVGKLIFVDTGGQVAIGPTGIGIRSGSEIKLSNINYDARLNGTWKVLNTTEYPYNPLSNIVYFQIIPRTGSSIPAFSISWSGLISFNNNPSPNAAVSFSTSNWKETMVIGSEAIRTETESYGNFKLGINTIARASHGAYTNAFVEPQNTDPRANLDIVGNAYISGRKTTDWLSHANYAGRNKNAIADAFVVGGDSTTPSNYSTLRVDTRTVAITEASRGNNLGRVGINTDETVTDKQLNRALVVVGDSRFTEDARFERDIEVYTDDGTSTAEIRTGITTGSFNLLDGSTTTQFTGQLSITGGVLSKQNSKGLRFGNHLSYVEIADAYTDDQFIFIGNNSDNSNIFLGDITDSVNAISKIQIGGAYGNNSSNSYTTFGTRRVNFAGDVVFGANKLPGGNRIDPERTVTIGTEAGIVKFFTGGTQTLDFATNASEINIGGQGGFTTIRNSLVVDAGVKFNSNINTCGGFTSFSFVGTRSQLGTIKRTHNSGIIGENTFIANVDLVNVSVIPVVNQGNPTEAELIAGYNRIDTAGDVRWGGNIGTSSFQVEIPGGGPQGATLPALTGLEYYLPMQFKPTPYFKAGDLLLIDSPKSSNLIVNVNVLDPNAYQQLNGVVLRASGVGGGGDGGFATGQNYISFEGGDQPRYVILQTINPTVYGVNSFGVSLFIGNNLNGGEWPDAIGESLKLQFTTSATPTNNDTVWQDVGFIFRTYGDGSGLMLESQTPAGLTTVELDLPEQARSATNLTVRLYQNNHTSVDNYGIISYQYLSESHPEIVRITEDGLQGAETEPYYLKVRRQPLGTFAPINASHPGDANVWKVNVASNATWITEAIDATGSQENVYLSEFGGNLTNNDYVIISREDTNGDGDDDKGEFFKIASFIDQVVKKFTIKNGCEPQTDKTVFEVDSILGNTTIGNSSIPNSGNLTINGSFTLNGKDCSPSSAVQGLTFKNTLADTVTINACTGNTVLGSKVGAVFLLGGYYVTTKSKHEISAPVHSYRIDPIAQLQPGNSNTTITAGILPSTAAIPVASILGFAKDDLVLISGADNTPAEIIRITGDPYTVGTVNYIPTDSNTLYPSGGRAQEQTTAKSFASGNFLYKIHKDPRTTNLIYEIPIGSERIPAPFPNSNPNRIQVFLLNGDIVQEKLDYTQWLRIGTEIFLVDSVTGEVDASFGTKLPKSVRYPNTLGTEIVPNYGGGELTINGDITANGGCFRMYGSDSQTLIFSVSNDDGHAGDGTVRDPLTGLDGLWLNGNLRMYGDLYVYDEKLQESNSPNILVMHVDKNDKKVKIANGLFITGQVSAVGSPIEPIFKIDNLGSAGTAPTGPRTFTMYQDGSIDAFGIKQYFTAKGGRRWTYVFQQTTGIGQQQTSPLQANNNYLLNCTSGGNMVLYLPSDANTGDMIRFIEISGTLQYNTNLVIRALKDGSNPVAIQGDVGGTKISTGASQLTVPWDSGELIVQTRNAAFGLVYVGDSDAPGDPNATSIPTNLQGWWLTEL